MIWNFRHYRTQDPPDAQTIYTFESRGFGGNAEMSQNRDLSPLAPILLIMQDVCLPHLSHVFREKSILEDPF